MNALVAVLFLVAPHLCETSGYATLKYYRERAFAHKNETTNTDSCHDPIHFKFLFVFAMGLVSAGLALTASRCVKEVEGKHEETFSRVCEIVPLDVSSYYGIPTVDGRLFYSTSDTDVTMDRLRDDPYFTHDARNENRIVPPNFDPAPHLQHVYPQ